MPKDSANQQYQYMIRHIGSTTYKVKVIFDEAGETMEEKILRMIQNEDSGKVLACGIMETPLMGRQSERSAS